MIEGLRNAWRLPDLRRKILYTIFIIFIYQLAAHIPVPGVNRDALQSLVQSSGGGGFIGVLDLLSGGAVSNFSVIANGVYPYITASIIIQLLVPIIPRLEAIVREPGGQDKQNQWTYYLAIPMSALQAIGQIRIFEQLGGGTPIISGFGEEFLPTATIVVTMTAGTMFAIWLGERITEQGIGQGLSVIIFAGIVARVPSNFGRLFGGASVAFNLASFVILTVATVLIIVVVQEGVRRIPVQYGKRVRGRKQYGGGSTHIPLRVNTAGMIPLIFAQSIAAFPSIIVSFLQGGEGTLAYALNQAFGSNSDFGSQIGMLYWGFYFALVVGFTYFYTDVMIQNQNLAENLQKQGGFIPGIRPGKRTQDYITHIVRRITLVGAMFLGLVAVLPGIMQVASGIFVGTGSIGGINPAYVISGSGLIIVVGVVIDTMRQLEAQLMMRNYEGFMR